MSATTRRPVRMNMRWWHKWVGILIGLLLFGWTASGIVMLLPQTPVATLAGVTEPLIDFSQVTLTPAQAAEIATRLRADTATGAEANPRTVSLRPVLGTPVYVVTPKRGQPTLVHAVSGEPFVITPERAGTIASQALGDIKVAEVERSTGRPSGYFGPTPVFRVTFADGGDVVAYVVESTGELQRTRRLDRVMSAVGHSFHVFLPLSQLPGGGTTRKGSLIITGLIAIVSIVTGYWLAIPRRWLRKSTS